MQAIRALSYWQRIGPLGVEAHYLRGMADRDSPVGSGHLRIACEQLVRQMLDAGLTDAARSWRNRMMGELRVPLESRE